MAADGDVRTSTGAPPQPTSSTGEDSGSDETPGCGAGREARPHPNQRRARRYHTADTIHDLDGRPELDSAIHKRLSLNYGGSGANSQLSAGGDVTLQLPGCSSSTALSCESLGSFPSSSGVSSTASLYRTAAGDDADHATLSSSPREDCHDLAATDPAEDEVTTEDGLQTADECQLPATSTSSSDTGQLTAAQRLQLLVAERRRLNQELLFMNPALEAS